MKKLISLFSLVLLLLVATQSFAQIKFGVKTGLNITNMLSKNDDEKFSKDFVMKPGLHLGATAELPISESFAMETGLLFSMKGYKYDKNDYRYTLNINYLEVPVNAVYKINLEEISILLHTGPYLGYALSGKVKSDKEMFGENGDKKKYTIKFGNNKDKDDMKPLDFGLNFGAGIGINSFIIDFQYGLGLANLSPYTENRTKLKNKVIGISIGYKFGNE